MRCPLAGARLLAIAMAVLLASIVGAEGRDASVSTELPPAAERPVDFRADVQPLLRARCHSCHGAEMHEAGLRLDVKQRAMEGGDSGAVIVPGKSGESRLIRRVAGVDADLGQMPPAGEGTPLTAEEIGVLRKWIDQGAAWPDAADGLAGQTAHWSFQPIRRPSLPAVRQRDWVINSIDAFLVDRLEQAGVPPSPSAPKTTLLRRVYLDLIGLPPTPDEVTAFVADDRPDAYERVVDRLLASPHYGERWGRAWLDLARYADSDGYEKDQPRPHAWRYRQWVIEALNADMPFDAFSIAQIAGDLLPHADLCDRLATGFHRNTLHNAEGGADPEEDRVKKTIDRTNTVATVWLGLTLGCAQCHSHKYDPLSQREYFSFYAFFDGIDETNLNVPGEKGAQAQTVAERAAPRATRIHVRGDFLSPGEAVSAGTPRILPPLRAGPAPGDATAHPDSQRPQPTTPLASPAGNLPAERLGANPTMAAGERRNRLDLARWLVAAENPLTARVAANRVWQRLFGRGLVRTADDFGTQGEPPTHPELLDWLADEFRSGGWSEKRLVRLIVTSNAYRQSSALRAELENLDPENALLARQNRLRVEAEIVRDLALAASGLWDSRIGGPSVRPRQPPDHAQLTYANSAKWEESRGGDAYRRGLYTFFQRTSPYPFFVTFDAPDSNECCILRERSNTPLQSLSLWNDTVFYECAQHLARRIVCETPSAKTPAATLESRVRHAFCLCLGRAPDGFERAAIERLYDLQLAHCRHHPATVAGLLGKAPTPAGVSRDELAAWVAVGRTLMNLDEFITRE